MSQLIFRNFVMPAVFAAAALALSASAAPEGDTVGAPWTGEPGIHERTRDLMERDAAHVRGQRSLRVHKHPPIEFPEEAAGILAPTGSTDAGALDAGSSTAQTVSTT